MRHTLDPIEGLPHDWKLYSTSSPPCILYRANLDVCVDGSPKAYHPNEKKGYDCHVHGKPGEKWEGVVTDSKGDPYVQKNGPTKGFYVSGTALSDSGNEDDQAIYVDPLKINYLVVPKNIFVQLGLYLGNIGFIYSTKTRIIVYAIFAETGPSNLIGEASVRAAWKLGIVKNNPRDGGDGEPAYIYGIFPGSGLKEETQTQAYIDEEGTRLMSAWGGIEALLEVLDRLEVSHDQKSEFLRADKPCPPLAEKSIPCD